MLACDSYQITIKKIVPATAEYLFLNVGLILLNVNTTSELKKMYNKKRTIASFIDTRIVFLNVISASIATQDKIFIFQGYYLVSSITASVFHKTNKYFLSGNYKLDIHILLTNSCVAQQK